MHWTKIAALFMLLAVALGAFGGHALRGKLDGYGMDIYKTANLYHFIHALGLFMIGWLTQISSDPKINLAGIFLTAGIILFSGSLYLLAVSGQKFWGAVTPLGGLSFMIGWGLIIFSKLVP